MNRPSRKLAEFLVRSASYGRDVFFDLPSLANRWKQILPPPRLMKIYGTADIETYLKNGADFYRDSTEIGNLKSNESVLDIGCGIGEKTRPLIGYLNGRYEGVDIIKVGINWCKKRISSRHPNFHFQVIDVYNQYYNPKGKQRASGYQFPFQDASFDFIYLGSVFTHMLPADIKNYVFEIARMLKKGGRCMATFFLLNDSSRDLIKAGKSSLDFKYALNGGHLILDKEKPERAICYNETYALQLFKQAGLITKKPFYGYWCGREAGRIYQDYVLGFKEWRQK